MSGWLWPALAAAGAAGAVARYVVDGHVAQRVSGILPWGTLVVNVTGSLLLGFLTGLALYHAFPSAPKLVIGGGLCGAYTTFSTFAFETAVLAREEDARRAALANVALSVSAGCVAAGAGLALAAL